MRKTTCTIFIRWSYALCIACATLAHAAAAPATETGEHFDPVGLLLTWQQDPTTTMTIDWHTLAKESERTSLLEYKASGSGVWQSVNGESHPFPFSDRRVHRVELTGLEPATEYSFRFGPDSRAYKFRTMPASITQPMRFIIGGDTFTGYWFKKMNRVAMLYDPEFIVWGGDLPYADGQPANVGRWYQWFEEIKQTLIDDEGRVVPILCAIGNHEIFSERRVDRFDYSPEDLERFREIDGLRDGDAPYFFSLLAFPGKPAYQVLDFANYLSLVFLDSGHYSPVAGEQTEWLKSVLQERRDTYPHLFPIYHVPAYPSVRAYHNRFSQEIRDQWVPLFEANRVKVAFEHHDHAYKRTYPIRDGRISDNGVVYIGDGLWGAGARDPLSRAGENPVDWYLKRTAREYHGIVVTLQGQHQHFLMVNADNEIIDEYPQTTLPWPVPKPVLPEVVAKRIGKQASLSAAIPLPEDNWQFRLDPEAVGRTEQWFDATQAKALDWDEIAIAQRWQAAGYDYVGYAWYQMDFALPEGVSGDMALLFFEAVDENAWVWVNGKFVGEQDMGPSGYIVPFELDVSDSLIWDAKNHLSILVRSTAGGGGIYRPITLQVYQR